MRPGFWRQHVTPVGSVSSQRVVLTNFNGLAFKVCCCGLAGVGVMCMCVCVCVCCLPSAHNPLSSTIGLTPQPTSPIFPQPSPSQPGVLPITTATPQHPSFSQSLPHIRVCIFEALRGCTQNICASATQLRTPQPEGLNI